MSPQPIGYLHFRFPIRSLRQLRVSLTTGPFGTALNASEYVDEGIPLINPAHIRNGRFIPDACVTVTPETASRLARHKLRDGDLVVGRHGDVGRSAVVTKAQEGWLCGSGSIAIHVDPRHLLPNYLQWVLADRYTREQLTAASNGATMDTINEQILMRLDVPCPDRTTQRVIADYLDRETARIDALIQAKLRMMELLEERFRVVRIDLVTGRDDPIRQAGPSWLGSIPRAWRLARLKFLASMESGHTPNRQVDAYWVDCTIPWITLNDVSDLEHSWRFRDPKNAINELGLRNSSAQILPADAVAMSRDATVGRAALLGCPMAVSQHFVAWICSDELLPEYLLNVIRGPMQHLFGSLTAGATIATIGMPDLNQLVVPVPPRSEQARIAKRVAEVEDVARKAIDTIRRQLLLLQERRHALITAAVTGQLDIPEAA